MRAWLKNPADGKAADVIEADESEVGLTRTRCVATRLFGGHADNALPQLATATINCRMLPDEKPEEVKAAMRYAFIELKIVLEPSGAVGLAAVLAGKGNIYGAAGQALQNDGVRPAGVVNVDQPPVQLGLLVS